MVLFWLCSWGFFFSLFWDACSVFSSSDDSLGLTTHKNKAAIRIEPHCRKIWGKKNSDKRRVCRKKWPKTSITVSSHHLFTDLNEWMSSVSRLGGRRWVLWVSFYSIESLEKMKAAFEWPDDTVSHIHQRRPEVTVSALKELFKTPLFTESNFISLSHAPDSLRELTVGLHRSKKWIIFQVNRCWRAFSWRSVVSYPYLISGLATCVFFRRRNRSFVFFLAG